MSSKLIQSNYSLLPRIDVTASVTGDRGPASLSPPSRAERYNYHTNGSSRFHHPTRDIFHYRDSIPLFFMSVYRVVYLLASESHNINVFSSANANVRKFSLSCKLAETGKVFCASVASYSASNLDEPAYLGSKPHFHCWRPRPHCNFSPPQLHQRAGPIVCNRADHKLRYDSH